MNAPQWQPRRARHLNADDFDPASRKHLGDRLLIGFGILVALYFVGQLIRGLVQHGFFG
ncbi:MAG TPA: hypothetical protein VGF77_08290 [Allosphingosinicella sp.]|jgi:hypothetical protein